jgi:regulator of nonsense transcripts 2
LIATILETCGQFFDRGAAGKKLDYFLSFFQYYIYTKAPLPMDIEFIVQDMFSLTRPQWKLASNLEEASKAFQLAVEQDQRMSGSKATEQEDGSSESSSDDENGDDLPLVDQDDDEESSTDELEAEVCAPDKPGLALLDSQANGSLPPQDNELDIPAHDSESEEEAIVVTRQEEHIDPEFEAEFEREYARMMAESLESRKFERKQQFDLPVPVRSKNRDAFLGNEAPEDAVTTSGGTMAFSLLTKKGNRQQVRFHDGDLCGESNHATNRTTQTKKVELPSDSTFAVAMKNQQQAEKEEQQRIKTLVLNYDLRENEDQDGETCNDTPDM